MTRCRPTCSTNPELETEAKQATWTLNFGPQHPATHTTLRLILELDGERIVKATPDIGYLHSGFEKLGEHLNFNQYVTIVDRKNYISPPMNEVAWHHAVEKLLDIELTPRCQYIRVIISELARISDHLLCTGAAALDLGAFTAFLFAFNLRELIYDVYEEMSGYRFHPGYTRVGGVLTTSTTACSIAIQAVLDSFPQGLLRHGEAAVPEPDLPRPAAGRRCALQGRRDRLFVHRADRAGQRRHLRPAQGRALPGLSRVRLRGPLHDRRRLLGPVHRPDGGDAAEPPDPRRRRVKKLPGGPVNVPIAEKFPLPDKLTTYNSMEGLIQHFELIMPNRGVESPRDEIYAAVESPNGELGYYLVADGSQTAWRVRTRPPSFIHFSVFPTDHQGPACSPTSWPCWEA